MSHIDLKKVFDNLSARRERFESERRVGSVGLDRETNAILFYADAQASRYRYWIPFDELQEPEGQMRWIYQLRTKSWLTIEILRDFLDCLEYLGVRPRT